MSTKNRLNPIPHPPTMPVIGNMLSLDWAAPVQHLTRLAKELRPIFWLDMMGALLVIVSGHELVDELSDETRFDKAVRGALRRVRAVGGDGLFTADTSEPNWSKAHNILLQPFDMTALTLGTIGLCGFDCRFNFFYRQDYHPFVERWCARSRPS